MAGSISVLHRAPLLMQMTAGTVHVAEDRTQWSSHASFSRWRQGVSHIVDVDDNEDHLKMLLMKM